MSRDRSALVAGIVSAVVWALFGGLLAAVIWFGLYRGDIVALVLPQTISPQYWQLDAPWPVLIPAASTLAIGGFVWWSAQFILPRAAQTPHVVVVMGVWFMVIASAAVVGAVNGLAELVGRGVPGSLSSVAQGLPDAIAPALYWGLIVGWLPAVLATIARKRAVPPPSGFGRIIPLIIALSATVLLLVSVVIVTQQARAAGLAGQAPPALQQPAPAPVPTGTPPPIRATGPHPVDPSWCVDSELTFADLGGDGATGHREQTISATNSGRNSCVLPGYPDLAFADDHGIEVPAEVHEGSGFMTQDAGAVPITLAPGEAVVSMLAWDATDGRTTISHLFVAPYAGADRVLLVTSNGMDITAATQVAVTAWARPTTPPGS